MSRGTALCYRAGPRSRATTSRESRACPALPYLAYPPPTRLTVSLSLSLSRLYVPDGFWLCGGEPVRAERPREGQRQRTHPPTGGSLFRAFMPLRRYPRLSRAGRDPPWKEASRRSGAPTLTRTRPLYTRPRFCVRVLHTR